MKGWTLRVTPVVREWVSKLHPDHKKLIKNALKEMKALPFSGSALHGELSGFRSFKPKRFRIIYKVHEEERLIEIYYIGHRRDVYEKFLELLKQHLPE